MSLAIKTVLDSIATGVNTTLVAAVEAVSTKLGTPTSTNLANDLTNTRLPVAATKTVKPSLANGVVATGGAGVWAEGAYVEVVPANGINAKFGVYAVLVEAITGVHQVTLASGGAGAEVPFCTIALGQAGRHLIQGPLVAANARVAVKTASKAGGAQTVTVYIETYTGLQ